MDKDTFEIQKQVVDWMMEKGCTFVEAVCAVAYAEQSDKSICDAYFELLNTKKQQDKEAN